MRGHRRMEKSQASAWLFGVGHGRSAVVEDHLIGALDLGGALLGALEHHLALFIGCAHGLAGVIHRLGLLGALAVVGLGCRLLGFFCGFGIGLGFGVSGLFGFELLVLASGGLGSGGTASRGSPSSGGGCCCAIARLALLGRGCDLAQRRACARGLHALERAIALGALEDVLLRHLQSRWAVAEDLAAVFVDPLPLGHGGRANANGYREEKELDEFHRRRV